MPSWGAEPVNIPYIFPWSVGLFIWSTRLFIWSTRLFIWSTRLFIWSTRLFLWSTRLFIWSTRLFLWSTRLFLWSTKHFLYGQLSILFTANFQIFNDVHSALRPNSNKDGCHYLSLGVTIQHSVDVVRLLIFSYMKYKSHLNIFFFKLKKVSTIGFEPGPSDYRTGAIH